MKKCFTIIFLFLGTTGFSQNKFSLDLESAFQPYHYKSIYFGASINRQNSWKIKDSDTYRKSIIYYERFINEPDLNKMNILGYTFLFGTKYFNAGINVRHLFIDKIHRLDLEPMFRIGYKYAWVSYSIDLLAFDNPYSKNQENIINLNKYENNVKLIVSIPIFNKK